MNCIWLRQIQECLDWMRAFIDGTAGALSIAYRVSAYANQRSPIRVVSDACVHGFGAFLLLLPMVNLPAVLALAIESAGGRPACDGINRAIWLPTIFWPSWPNSGQCCPEAPPCLEVAAFGGP